MTKPSLARWMALVQEMPEEVKRPLERLGRELSYLQQLLNIEGRGEDWGQIETLIQGIVTDLARGALDRAAAQVEGVERALTPWADLAKSLTLYYVGHAHMDMNWLWDWPETVEVVINTLTTVDRLMDEFPDFCFSQSQTAVYDAVRRFDPGLFDRIGERVRQGRWEITANQWVEGDKNLASDESIVRHILYSKEFFAKHWGIASDHVAIDFEPDTFGHPRGLPTIYRDAGLRWLYFCRGGSGDLAFRWQAPDGSEIVAWSDFQEWYNGTITGDEVGSALKFYEESRIPHFLKVYGVGDHGGGPTRRDLERLMEMRTWPIFPTLKPAHLADHFRALEAERERLPIVRGELNYVFPGCYSSEGDTKTMNARNEAGLRSAEGLRAMAHLLGVALPSNHESLKTAWEGTLFSQFHDILSGSGIPETYRYTLGRGQDVDASARIAAQQAMATISGAIGTETLNHDGTVLVVFNPLAWDRSDIVEMDVYERFDRGTSLHLLDSDGRTVPVQYFYDSHLGFPGHRRVRISFPANVPGLGYAVYILSEGVQALAENTRDVSVVTRAEGHQTLCLSGQAMASLGLVSVPDDWRYELLPRWIRLFRQLGISSYQQGYRIDSDTETLEAKAGDSGLWWSRTASARGLSGMGALEWFREAPHGMTAWEIGADTERTLVTGSGWKIREIGPVRAVLESEVSVGSSDVQISVMVYADRPRIDWLLEIDWREFGNRDTGIPGLTMRFPVEVSAADVAWFGQSMGSITRPIPSRDVPAQGWTAIAGSDGASVVYHPTRYGVSVSEQGIAVTLLRASYDPDAYAEIGHHQIPLSFEWSDQVNPDSWTRKALEQMSRLSGWVGGHQKGVLPSRRGTLALASEGGVITAVKPAEDGSGVIVRMRQDSDQSVPLELVTDAHASCRVSRTSILESPVVTPVSYEGNRLSVPVSAYGLATVRMEFSAD